MVVVGLTGGIGSGKSTVSALFAALGVPVIDADVISKELLNTDHQLEEKILAYFGNEIVDENQQLDRKKLRELVFADTQKREWLESLLHPAIIDAIKQTIKQLDTPYCIVVIPLLTEVPETQLLVNRILVVDVPEEIQINRTMQRDKLTEAEIKHILAAQTTRAIRLNIADDVITNDGDETSLREQVVQLDKIYRSL